MKMPELPRRKPDAPAAGRGGIKSPAFVSDLFKDMRDRRLIIPAIALLIAIVAVPILLASEPEPLVPAPPPSLDPDAAALEPSVLVEQGVGVRDFRERLGALRRKNPFGDRFEAEAPKEAEAQASQLVDPEESSGAETPVVPEASENRSAGGAATSEVTDTPSPEEPFVLVPRVDVEVGDADRDRRKTIESVRPGDLLPSKQAPVAMFLGNSDDSSSARFLVSRDVSRVNGEGECRRKNNGCEFLLMEDGDSAYFRFADGKRYVISLRETYFERIPQSEFDRQG